MENKVGRMLEELRLKTDDSKFRMSFEEKRTKCLDREFEIIKSICNGAAAEGKVEVLLTNWSSKKQFPHLSRGTPMSSRLMDRIQREGLSIREIRREQDDGECEECVRIEFDYILSWARPI